MQKRSNNTSKPHFFVIINPVSGNRQGVKVWQNIKLKLEDNFTINYQFTDYPKHETQIAKQAVSKGFRQFIIIGGDGTLSNFIDGVFNQKTVDTKEITFGIIPIGTGNDWIKTYSISKNTNKALQTIIDGNTTTQDIGCISYHNDNLPNKYFINVAGIGYDGLVVDIVKSKRTLGMLIYAIGALKALFRFKLFETTITTKSTSTTYNDCFIIQLGICKYTGSGMQLTKEANPQDGLLDISVGVNFSKRTILFNALKLYNGKILDLDKVTTYKTNKLSVEFNNITPHFQADGEQLQPGAIYVNVVPNAINFYK